MSDPILNASSRIMYQEAQARQIHCTTFGDHETILMKKGEKTWYTRGSRTSCQSSVGATLANNKALTKKILNYFEIPTAKAIEIRQLDDISQLASLQFPVVMKPVTGTHGKDVIVGIETMEKAEQLLKKAELPVLFEEMLSGTEYRILCVDFQFVAAAFRKPAHVTGDGEKTIQELIDKKNEHPWRGTGHTNNLSLIEVDELVLDYLREQDFQLSSIPPKGMEVLLRKTANLSTGGEAWDVTEDVCQENRDLFEKIAKICDLNTIGIDMMCKSLQSPIILQANAGVIEVNDSPGLRMHHFPLIGKPRNIAGMILDMVDRKIQD